MLKDLAEYIAIPLHKIMANSFKEGSLPNKWKVAHMSPIYKKGNKNLAENYRPVCLATWGQYKLMARCRDRDKA